MLITSVLPNANNIFIDFQWYPEVRRYCQTTPLILCGCQSDLRNDFETLAKLAELQRIPVPAEQVRIPTYLRIT